MMSSSDDGTSDRSGGHRLQQQQDVDLERLSPTKEDTGRSDRRAGRNSRRDHNKQHPRQESDPPPWSVALLEAVAELRGEVNNLKKMRTSPPRIHAVNEGASTSHACSPAPSHDFTGFRAAPRDLEEGEVSDEGPFGSGLQLGVKVFGPADTVSEDIDAKVADMVNHLFSKGMRADEYQHIFEDEIVMRPNNCQELAPVECNPQIWDALRAEARRHDFRLKVVSKDILGASTIIIKSLLTLDKVAEQTQNPMIAQEVGLINGALALLGNANYKNNLARRAFLKREINPKYAHLCSEKVPVTRFLFGDDISQSTKQIDEAEKLRNKFSGRKPVLAWRAANSRLRIPWARQTQRSFAPRFQPYGRQGSSFRGNQRSSSLRLDAESKNSKTRATGRPR